MCYAHSVNYCYDIVYINYLLINEFILELRLLIWSGFFERRAMDYVMNIFYIKER